MKKKVHIKLNDGTIVFKGKSLNLPIKKDYIIKKSIEVFDDEDPCIIHQSYVIKLYVKEILDLVPEGKELQLSDVLDQIDFLDVDSKENCILIVEG
ncbi:hypothetical protein [Haloplasma contractile]|uniref:Uncharacterized protein n=1 Tax=Haloplasma contractile SSD-17B TaxID=1033810 RepID=F7Q1H0_9MOLU|nr:hypothetical protein [Haloplasma contractile]ERJ12894.1 hypothetical protein HLPCO_001234 [Haloplasma contractile SSD-17B]